MRDGSGIAGDAARVSTAKGAKRVRDVADFQNRWSEFRPVAAGALHVSGLSPAESDCLAWMIEVMDRIAPRDLEAPLPPDGAP